MTVKRTRGHPQIDKEGKAIVKTISITPTDLEYLLKKSAKLSNAIRDLIERERQQTNG